MTDDQIREAAYNAFITEYDKDGASEGDCFSAVFRAGMEAGREAERRGRGSLADPSAAGDMAALLRRLESDPEEATRFLAEIDTRGMLKAKPKRRKALGPEPFGFARFWTAWPASTRKGGKQECRKIWEDHGLEASELEIFCHVQAMCMTQDWTKDGGAYIPAPAVYLRQKRWDGAEMPDPVAMQKKPVESFASQAALARVQRISPGAARKDAEQQKNFLQKWSEVIDDAGQPRIR